MGVGVRLGLECGDCIGRDVQQSRVGVGQACELSGVFEWVPMQDGTSKQSGAEMGVIWVSSSEARAGGALPTDGIMLARGTWTNDWRTLDGFGRAADRRALAWG